MFSITAHLKTPFCIPFRMVRFMVNVAVVGLLLGMLLSDTEQFQPLSLHSTTKKVTQQPVVIDTDIGSFLDDFFAIAFAVQNSYLDVKLIITASDDTIARARITAKFMTLLGRDDIPIAAGVKNNNQTLHTFWDWAEDVNLSCYKGGFSRDGIQKMGEVIMASPMPVDILAIGPMTNFPSLLTAFPQVVKNANVQAMMGSIYKGYDNASSPSAEYNVKWCPKCANQLLHAGWNVTMTPLDTCGHVILDIGLEKELLSGTLAVSLTLADVFLYDCLTNTIQCKGPVRTDPPVLFDTVGTLLLLPNASSYIVIQELKLSVNTNAYTVIDGSHGAPVNVALSWQKTDGLHNFETYMVNVLMASSI